MAEKRRRRLEDQLFGLGCTLNPERRGSPYTLFVTRAEKRWHEHHDAWRERCREAGKRLTSIGVQALKQILGEDYERAISLKRSIPDSATPAPLRAVNEVLAHGSLTIAVEIEQGRRKAQDGDVAESTSVGGSNTDGDEPPRVLQWELKGIGIVLEHVYQNLR
ncbi:MAG: hypothetical protein Q9192_004058 [Flavoplaca navasiana]